MTVLTAAPCGLHLQLSVRRRRDALCGGLHGRGGRAGDHQSAHSAVCAHQQHLYLQCYETDFGHSGTVKTIQSQRKWLSFVIFGIKAYFYVESGYKLYAFD